MSSKVAKNLGTILSYQKDEMLKPSTRTQLSDQSVRSYFTADRPFKSNFQSSFMIDQENAKELEKIQIKAQELREKEKRERNILKKLKKIYEQQLKEFQQLEKVSKQALDDKSMEIQMLAMENTQLREEKIEFCTLKDENQLLTLKNQQLESEMKRLNQELESTQQNYRNLKVQFQQQAQILDKGIRENQIESEAPAFALPQSIQEVEQLSRELEELRKKDAERDIKKEEQSLKAQEQMNNCNFMLENLLKQIKKEEKEREQEGQVLEDKIIKSEHKLMGLTNELMKKTEELSKALGSSHKLEKVLKERQVEVSNLKDELSKLQQLYDAAQMQIMSQQSELEIYEDSEKVRYATESENKEKKAKNFERFQEKLQNLIAGKKIKEYSNVFDVFSSMVNEAFKAWNLSVNSGINTGDKYIESVLKIVENGLISLNDYFRQKSNHDVQRVQKMVGFIHNANSILKKRSSDDEYNEKDEQRDVYVENTPDRFLGKQLIENSHSRQQSESSIKSNKRSILLEEDIEDAVIDEDELDKIKEESLQEELSNIKNNQVILDSLNDGSSDKADTIKDAISESSFSKSKISEMSAAEQSKLYTDHKKQAILKGKLKKKKHHTKEG